MASIAELPVAGIPTKIMGKWEKLYLKIMEGNSDKNISFDDLCKLLERVGFDCRIRSSHHIYDIDGNQGSLNIQPNKEGKAKAYQVKLVREYFSVHNIKPK